MYLFSGEMVNKFHALGWDEKDFYLYGRKLHIYI